MEEYREIKLLGRGNFGSAVLVEKLSDRRLYAVKKISIAEMPSAERDKAKQEVVILANMRHPCIVRYEGSFIQGTTRRPLDAAPAHLTPSSSLP